VGDWIIDSDDHLQRVTDAGTSGGSEPAWPVGVNTPTVDGSVTWLDEGAVPTVGSARLYASRATPAAP